jgi:hypothetical protein
MKLHHLTTLLFGLAIATLTSCVTTTTVEEFPDGRKVTTTVRAVDPAAFPLAEAVTHVIDEK